MGKAKLHKGNRGTGVKHHNTTMTSYVSRRPGANLYQAAEGLPPLANGLVDERLNEPSNSQGCNQCETIKHTQKEETQY